MRDNIWCSRNTCPKCPIGSGQKEHPRYFVWKFPTWKPTWASLQGSLPTWRRWREETPWSQYNRSCLCRMCGTRVHKTFLRSVLESTWRKSTEKHRAIVFPRDSPAWILYTTPGSCPPYTWYDMLRSQYPLLTVCPEIATEHWSFRNSW